MKTKLLSQGGLLDQLKETICERCEENENKEKCMILKTKEKDCKWYCLIHSAQELAIEDVREEGKKNAITWLKHLQKEADSCFSDRERWNCLDSQVRWIMEHFGITEKEIQDV